MIFERRTPESQGVDSRLIKEFAEKVGQFEGHENHHFMVVRHGFVVAEGTRKPYKNGGKHQLYSVSKAFTSTAIGFLVADGKIDISDKIIDYFPEYKDSCAEGVDKITVKNLLTMASGQKTGGEVHLLKKVLETDRLGKFFATPSENPGTLFRYDGGCSYALSRLVTKVSGKGLDEFLEERLFSKLGISTPIFEKCAMGYCVGASGMMISIEEMAALGQFYLNGGVWKGERLLPKEWIDEATKKQIGTEHVTTGDDWHEGYCYHFWRGRHDTFRFCGAHGQMCVCMPDKDAMLLVQSAFANEELYRILDLFYDTLYKGFYDKALPEVDLTELNNFINSLELPEGHKPLEKWEVQ